MAHEKEQWPIQKRRTSKHCDGVQAGPALARAQAVLVKRLALSGICGIGPKLGRHSGSVRSWCNRNSILASQAQNHPADDFGNKAKETLGIVRQRQPYVEQTRGTQSEMAWWCYTRTPSVLYKQSVACCMFDCLETRQRQVPTLWPGSSSSARHADAHTPHCFVLRKAVKSRSIKSRFAVRNLPSLRSFTEEC